MSGRGRVTRRLVAVLTATTLTTPLVGAGGTASAVADTGVLRTTIVFPTGAPAPGAEVRLTAQPDPVWPTTGDGQVEYPREVEWVATVADDAGVVSFDVPETAALVDLAQRQGGTVRAVLSYTAQQGSDELPVYYKGVTPYVLTYDASTMSFGLPHVRVGILYTLPEFDATLVQALGEKTIKDVGTLLDSTDPYVIKLTSALEEEMRNRGYLFDNEAVAYNVSMLGGTYTWVTLAPQYLLVRESPDADVYDVVGITTGGFPAVDTTDAGDGVDHIVPNTSLDDVEAKKKQRGKWRQHHGDCYAISGPVDRDTKRYKRTVCYRVDHQEMDTTKGTSYWQYEEDASGTSVGGSRMERLWVHGQPYGHGTAVAHTQALPQPSQTEYGEGTCTTTTDSISVASGAPVTAGLSRSWAKTKCKRSWHGPVLKGDGEHAAEWETEEPIREGHVRAIALALPVEAPTKDGCPIWNILSGQWVR